jgi:hypothetical protein
MAAKEAIVPRPLTPAQKKELLLLACGDQLTYGSARARVQNNLVTTGLARFLEIDGIGVCRITDRGRKVLTRGRVSTEPIEGAEPSLDDLDDLRRRLRSLRAQRIAIESDLITIDRRIEEAEAVIVAMERA